MKDKIIGLLLLVLLFPSCSKPQVKEETINSVYYWKTTFRYGNWEKEYIKDHDIRKIYLRLFDIDYAPDYNGITQSIPIATVIFQDNIPKDVEIVPVVYITCSAIQYDPHFGDKLYRRVKAIAKKNGFANFKEVQLDCDWTVSTRELYFELCNEVGELCHRDGRIVSSTIRLHQLRSLAPPVDKGTLMFYNTGNLRNIKTANSILQYDDVKPYLKAKVQYGIPLSYAYPSYKWGILFHDSEFSAILHKSEFANDSLLYKGIGNNFFSVLKDHQLEDNNLHIGDCIRAEYSDSVEINKVQVLANKFIGVPKEIIMYHLDSSNLSIK